MGVNSYIGLGANLDNPIEQIKTAFIALDNLPKSILVSCSSLYTSEPMGEPNQQNYINAVAKLETALSPIKLLDYLQQIENNQGRIRSSVRWSARTLDLDILLFGNKNVKNERLTIPHYGIKQRNFVVIPLAEIEPLLCLPDGSRIQDIKEQLGSQGIQKL